MLPPPTLPSPYSSLTPTWILRFQSRTCGHGSAPARTAPGSPAQAWLLLLALPFVQVGRHGCPVRQLRGVLVPGRAAAAAGSVVSAQPAAQAAVAPGQVVRPIWPPPPAPSTAGKPEPQPTAPFPPWDLVSYFFRLWFSERNQHINDFFSPQKPLNNSFWRVFAFLLAVWCGNRWGDRGVPLGQMAWPVSWACAVPVAVAHSLGARVPCELRSSPASSVRPSPPPPLALRVPEAFNQTGAGAEPPPGSRATGQGLPDGSGSPGPKGCGRPAAGRGCRWGWGAPPRAVFIAKLLSGGRRGRAQVFIAVHSVCL